MRGRAPTRRRFIAGMTALGVLGAGLITAPAVAAESASVDTRYLADSTDAQQRWLSVPNSRIVLNPFNSDGTDSELEQTTDETLPLHVGYYAADNAILQKRVLETYATSGERPEGSDYRSALAESFDDPSDWSDHGVTTSAADGVSTVTLDGGEWGHIERTVEVADAADTRFLTIDVASVSTGSTWNVKIAGENGDDLPDLQADSDETGEFVFDLADAYGWESGARTVTVKIYAVNKTGEPGGSVALRSLSFDNAADLPWDGAADAVVDDLDTAAGWARAANSGFSASVVADGSQTTVRLGDHDFGAVERSFTVDLDRTPQLSVRAAETSGQWALKLSSGSGDDISVQPDTSQTGLVTYDIAAATGWSGERTFTVKLFHIGKDGYSTFNDLGFHPGSAWLASAESYTNEWRPEALSSFGEYSDGSIDVVDAFHDADSFSRSISASTAGVAAAGVHEGAASWDPAARVLTVTGEHHTYAIAFPEGVALRFGGSVAELSLGGGSAEPLDGNGAWAAALPAGTSAQVIGVGMAVRDARVTPDAAAAAHERAVAAAQDAEGDRAEWASFWDEFLVSVPQVQDFSIQRVADGGVTADEMRRFWFKAWVNLQMNVLPATPETGNEYAQLGTGKPSMWMYGTPGTKNVASWDSLLGMQQLAYVDPDNAWASFQGMMALVEDGSDATEPSDEIYGTRGELGGESLPSRKAQTAWVLYSITGDQSKLESTYEPLALHLNWERYNMRWVLGENNHFDERDSEFVTSLAYDLEFAIKIAKALDRDEDVAEYQAVIDEISASYTEWFFPAGADDDGKVWDTVQKVYLDESRGEVPFGDDTEGHPFRNEDGQWVRPGFSFYTSTAFVMDELDEQSMVKTMDRFLDDYDENKQLAGLGDFAVKAPDLQLLTYGLLDMEAIEGSTAPELRDRATVMINSIIRDMVRSGWFAEVYYADGDPGEQVGARGVRPSLFGISNYIDFVLMSNGVRTDEGDPTFVRLAGATGGVSGLTYLGEQLNVDVDETAIRFSGAAAEGQCDVNDTVEGDTVTWSEECGETPGGSDGSEGSDGSDGSDGSNDSGAGNGDSGSATSPDGELAITGADAGWTLLALLAAAALTGGGIMLVRRRRAAAE